MEGLCGRGGYVSMVSDSGEKRGDERVGVGRYAGNI